LRRKQSSLQFSLSKLALFAMALFVACENGGLQNNSSKRMFKNFLENSDLSTSNNYISHESLFSELNDVVNAVDTLKGEVVLVASMFRLGNKGYSYDLKVITKKKRRSNFNLTSVNFSEGELRNVKSLNMSNQVTRSFIDLKFSRNCGDHYFYISPFDSISNVTYSLLFFDKKERYFMNINIDSSHCRSLDDIKSFCGKKNVTRAIHFINTVGKK